MGEVIHPFNTETKSLELICLCGLGRPMVTSPFYNPVLYSVRSLKLLLTPGYQRSGDKPGFV